MVEEVVRTGSAAEPNTREETAAVAVVVLHQCYCASVDGKDSDGRVAWDATTPDDHDDDATAAVRNHWVDWEDTSWGSWLDDDEDCFAVVRNSNHHCD
jgi:hypothetical protein